MGAEGYTRVTKCKKNLADALAAAGMVLLCFVCMFPVAIMAQEPELCGPLAVPLLHQLKLDPGRKFIIKDPETAFTMLKEINRLLFYKEKKASRIFAENVFIF